MKRSHYIAHIVFMTAFILVILGMKSLWFDQGREQEARNAVIVEKVEKSSDDVVCIPQVDAESSRNGVIINFIVLGTVSFLLASYTSILTRRFLPARASPAHLA